jgi:putative ABC transport system permease protein
MTLVVRTTGDPARMTTAIQQVVQSRNRDAAVSFAATMEQAIGQQVALPRFYVILLSAFAGVAIVLAAVGVFGVISYSVVRRTREIGIRMALGAGGGRVVWLVMREVLLLAGIGVAIGLAAAWGATRWIATQLFGIQPTDVLTMILAAVGIAAVAALAGYLPARRAVGIDPMRALRWE